MAVFGSFPLRKSWIIVESVSPHMQASRTLDGIENLIRSREVFKNDPSESAFEDGNKLVSVDRTSRSPIIHVRLENT